MNLNVAGHLQEVLYRVAADTENLVPVERCIDNLELVYSAMLQLQDTDTNSIQADALFLVENALAGLLRISDYPQLDYEKASRGRPPFQIHEEQLVWLVENDFSGATIAMMLGVSESTIRRRMREFGLTVSQKFAILTNDELDRLVEETVRENLHSGYRMIHGILKGRGHCIQLHRIQESMRRVDAIGVSLRGLMLNVIRRRTYSVPGPQALWHIDGNHKLIRWRLVVHGGIDGHSRLIVYLGCASNNRAETVLRLFEAATRSFGIPSRVRSDKGMENVDIARFMLTHPSRGTGRNSMLTGPSTHNQRIERLWRDVFRGVLYLYHSIFTHMEEQGKLDPCSGFDLFCLHHVFIPRINRHLKIFCDGWNNHRLSSAGNKSPRQLWIEGMMAGLRQEDGMQNDNLQETYGIDWNGPLPLPGLHLDGTTVDVPETPILLAADIPLQNFIDPLQQSSTYGVDLYDRTRQFVRHAVQQ